VMMRRPRGVAVERVLPQRVPGRRQVQLQVAAVRHNLEAATTTSGAGVSCSFASAVQVWNRLCTTVTPSFATSRKQLRVQWMRCAWMAPWGSFL